MTKMLKIERCADCMYCVSMGELDPLRDYYCRRIERGVLLSSIHEDCTLPNYPEKEAGR